MEPPGTAPGSDPRITGAFIAIVTVARDPLNIGVWRAGRKRRTGKPKENARRFPSGRWTGDPLGDQKPDLINSNSSSMRLRMSWSIGVCDRRVPSIGFTSAAVSSSIEISAMAASLVEV